MRQIFGTFFIDSVCRITKNHKRQSYSQKDNDRAWLVHVRVNFADSNIPLCRGDIPLRRGDSWREVLFYSAQHYCFVWLSLLSQHCFQQQEAAFLRGKEKVNTGVGRDQNRAQRRVVLCQRVRNQTTTEWFGASKGFSTFFFVLQPATFLFCLTLTAVKLLISWWRIDQLKI